MLQLRPYQKDALQNVQKSFKNKIHKQLLVFPTEAGKTILFIAITQEKDS
ncbi:MAG: DEAD/DEAH box helicase family protein [Silvanigrellaceae bacterium]|nr:DEAD/DEAH box helicase family protein [Silvanigrellaceae bacterium]